MELQRFCTKTSIHMWPALEGLNLLLKTLCLLSSWHKHGRKLYHDDVMTWKIIPHYWCFVMESTDDLWIPLTKGQWWQLCGAFMFSLMLAWTSCWVNIRVSVDLRCHDVKGIYRWTVDSLTQSANNTSKVDFYVFIHVSVHKVLGKHSTLGETTDDQWVPLTKHQ